MHLDEDWSGAGTGMMYNLTDNVGIGTNNPTSRLTLGDGNLEFKTVDAGGKIGYDPSNNVFFIKTTTGTATPIIFGTSGSEWMRIDEDGNIGIGTVTPQSALQVNGYAQIDVTRGRAPRATDCDDAAELGRMKVDNVAGLLYICVDSGWVGK